MGQTATQSGAGVIASSFDYNADGQLKTLMTYPGGVPTNPDGADATTTWVYDPATGLLNSKSYNDGNKDFYAYNPAGQLKTLTEPGSGSGALSLSESFNYNAAGLQSGYIARDPGAADPNARVTASTVNQFDDQARAAVTASFDDGQSSTETDTYTELGQPQAESFSTSGGMAVTVAHGCYPVTGYGTTGSPNALASMTIQNLPSGQANAQTAYGYDSISGRLQSITVNGVTFTIGYVQGSTGQIGSITASVSGQPGGGLTTTFTPSGSNTSQLSGITAVSSGGTTVYNAQNIH